VATRSAMPSTSREGLLHLAGEVGRQRGGATKWTER